MSSKHKTETSSVETQPAGLTAKQRDKQKAKKKAKQGSAELRAKKKAAKAKGKQSKSKQSKDKQPKVKKPRCTAWCPAYDGELQQPWWVHPELHCTKKAGHTYQHHDKTNGWNWDDVYFE